MTDIFMGALPDSLLAMTSAVRGDSVVDSRVTGTHCSAQQTTTSTSEASDGRAGEDGLCDGRTQE